MPTVPLPTPTWKTGIPIYPGRYFIAKDKKSFDVCQYCTVEIGSVQSYNTDVPYTYTEIKLVEQASKKFEYKKFADGSVDMSDAKLLDVPINELYFYGPVFVPRSL